MRFKIARRTEECKNCGFCDLICTHQDNCTGCGACVDAYPYEAKILEEISERRKEVIIKVNHEKYSVPERITVLRGGVGTPYWLKPRSISYGFIEVACFAHGCILRCPTCQNWAIAYSAAEDPLSPVEAARINFWITNGKLLNIL